MYLINFPDFSKARTGDTIWSITNGIGTITRISLKKILPIKVEFFSSRFGKIERYFTMEGKTKDSDIYPTLYWKKFQITPPESALLPPKRTRKETRWFFVFKFSTHLKPEISGYYSSCEEAIKSINSMEVGDSKTQIWGPYPFIIEIDDK